MSGDEQTGKAWVSRQGREQQPVIVIDDFDPDPEGVIEAAAARDYRPIGPFFPGLRAPVEPARVVALRRSLANLIRQVFNLSDELNKIESYYSLVTTPAERLQPLQRLPHFDGVGPERIALLHHLGRAEKGGTAFYRHRATGFETMTAERLPIYSRMVNLEVNRTGLPPARYMNRESPLYEQIALYPARFNRLLIYRGNTLHTGDIPDDLDLTADPRTGRFSVNTFIWLES